MNAGARLGLIRALQVLACLLLAAGAVAGVANRELLDGDRFARHVDAVRMDGDVSQLIGAALSDQVISADQNLVALRPAIVSVLVTLVRSSTFSPIVEATTRQLHEAFTTPNSGQIVLRLADVTAVIVAALKTVAPDAASSLPPDLDVRLADAGAQSYAARTIHLAHVVSLLSWLLPLIGLICLAGSVGLSRTRQRTLASAGLSAAAAGVLLGIVTWVVGLLARSADASTLHGALVRASWDQLDSAFWRSAAVLAIGGWVVFAAAAAHLPQLSIAGLERRALDWLRDPGPGARWQLLAALALVAVGAAAVLDPLGTARAVVVLAGLAVLAEGIGRVAGISAAARAEGEAVEGEAVEGEAVEGEAVGPGRQSGGSRSWVRANAARAIVTAGARHRRVPGRRGAARRPDDPAGVRGRRFHSLQWVRRAVLAGVRQGGLSGDAQLDVRGGRGRLVHPRAADRPHRAAERGRAGAADRHLVRAADRARGHRRERAGRSAGGAGRGERRIRRVRGR